MGCRGGCSSTRTGCAGGACGLPFAGFGGGLLGPATGAAGTATGQALSPLLSRFLDAGTITAAWANPEALQRVTEVLQKIDGGLSRAVNAQSIRRELADVVSSISARIAQLRGGGAAASTGQGPYSSIPIGAPLGSLKVQRTPDVPEWGPASRLVEVKYAIARREPEAVVLRLYDDYVRAAQAIEARPRPLNQIYYDVTIEYPVSPSPSPSPPAATAPPPPAAAPPPPAAAPAPHWPRAMSCRAGASACRFYQPDNLANTWPIAAGTVVTAWPKDPEGRWTAPGKFFVQLANEDRDLGWMDPGELEDAGAGVGARAGAMAGQGATSPFRAHARYGRHACVVANTDFTRYGYLPAGTPFFVAGSAPSGETRPADPRDPSRGVLGYFTLDNGVEGWIHPDGVEVDRAAAANAAPSSSLFAATVNATGLSGLNVRERPSLTTPIVRSLENGTAVPVLESGIADENTACGCEWWRVPDGFIRAVDPSGQPQLARAA